MFGPKKKLPQGSWHLDGPKDSGLEAFPGHPTLKSLGFTETQRGRGHRNEILQAFALIREHGTVYKVNWQIS